MRRTECLLQDRQPPPVERFGLRELPLRVVQDRQIVEGACQARVAWAEVFRFPKRSYELLLGFAVVAFLKRLLAGIQVALPESVLREGLRRQPYHAQHPEAKSPEAKSPEQPEAWMAFHLDSSPARSTR